MVQERIVVGVAGGSASGKTTLVSHLAKAFEGHIACCITTTIIAI